MLISHFDIDRDRRNNFIIKADLSLDPGESVSDYIYKILVSYHDESQTFKYIGEIDGVDVVGDRISFTDTFREYNMNRVRYYRIDACDRVTQIIYYQSPLSYLGAATDGIHATIQYYESLLNNLYIGTPCLLLRRVLNERAHRCPHCWDNETKQIKFGHCETCYGTSFVGGYYSPIEVQIAINNVKQNNTPEDIGENTYNKQLEGRTSHFPVIKPKDIIVDMDRGKRYMINDIVSNTKLPQISSYENQKSGEQGIMSQIFRMTELVSDDIVYDIDPDTLTNTNPIIFRYVINNDKIQPHTPDIYKYVISFGDKYQITVTGDDHAVIPGDPILVPEGYSRTVYFTADFGFAVEEVIIDGVDQGSIESYTFEDVESNHTAYVETVSVTMYEITTTTDFGSNILPSGPIGVAEGDDIEFGITSDVGYLIDDVLVDEASIGVVASYTFLDVNDNHNIEAVSRAPYGYTIVASAGIGGVIAPDGNVSISEGSDATFIITPDAEYEILNVLVNGVSVGAVEFYTFVDVMADATIEAVFTADTDIDLYQYEPQEVNSDGQTVFTLTFIPKYPIYVSMIIADGGVELVNVRDFSVSGNTVTYLSGIPLLEENEYIIFKYYYDITQNPTAHIGLYQYESQEVIINGQTVFTLAFIPKDPTHVSMIVADGGVELVNVRDFSVSGNVVTYLAGTPLLAENENIIFKYYYDIAPDPGDDLYQYEPQEINTDGQTVFTLDFTPKDSTHVSMIVADGGVELVNIRDFSVSGNVVTYQMGTPLLEDNEYIIFKYHYDESQNPTANIGLYQYEPQEINADGQTVFTLDFIPKDPTHVSMIIADGGVELINIRDFSVSGNTVTYLSGTPLLIEDEYVVFKYYYDESQNPTATIGLYQYESQEVNTNGQTIFTLDFTPKDPTHVSMVITDGGVELVNIRDFSVSGNTVTYLSGAPLLAENEYVIFKYYY